MLTFRSLFFSTCVFASLVCLATAKRVTGNFQLEAGDFDSGPEYEVTKYSFAIGKGLVRGKFKYKNPHTWRTSPALYLFMDDKWDDYHFAPACEEKVAHAHASIPIGEETDSHRMVLHSQLGKATRSEVAIKENGMVEFVFEWEIDTDVRTRGWFLLVADCALEQFNTVVPPMDYDIELFNPGLTHLPADEHGLPKLYLLVFIGMAAMFLWILTKVKQQYDETKKVHLIVLLLAGAYLFQMLSMFNELVHLYFYKHNGVGLFVADLFSEIFEGLSQTVISFVLICLASGWTLVEAEADESKGNSVATLLRNPQRMLKGANVVVVVIIGLVVLSMVLQVLNKSYDDDFSKFHDHESAPGKFLVFIRFLLGCFFVVSLHFTIQAQSLRGGAALIKFLRLVMLFGGVWFLAFPLLVISASMFPHYWRHRIVTGGVLLLQTDALVFLSYEFLSHSSTYFKISTLADSGVLPGAGGLVRAPKYSKD